MISHQLKTGPGDLLPFNTEGLPNQPDNSLQYFLAGDVRVNENVALTSIQTLFVREHNLWCDALKQSHTVRSDDCSGIVEGIQRCSEVPKSTDFTLNLKIAQKLTDPVNGLFTRECRYSFLKHTFLHEMYGIRFVIYLLHIKMNTGPVQDGTA